tara:strand:+ start:11213 stop:11344 length:132 start_codon:yes stop_codon:yes gene_type:complete
MEYPEKEIFLIWEGKATITIKNNEIFKIKQGDLVELSKGLLSY